MKQRFAPLAAGLLVAISGSASRAAITNLWTFEEGSGSTSANIVASSSTGDVSISLDATGGLGAGGSVWAVDGTRGSVISFNGNDSTGAYATAASAMPQAEVNGTFTWAFWVNLTASGTGGNDVVFGNRFGGPSGRWSKFTPSNFEWQANSGGNVNIPDMVRGVWEHHAIVKDGNNFTHYLNGSLSGATGNFSGTHTGDLPIGIGGDPGGGGERIAGFMDDVATFDEALNATQIMNIMNGDFTEFGIPEPSTSILSLIAVTGLLARRRRR